MAARVAKAAAEDASPGNKADVREPLPLHAGARLTARVVLAIVLLLAAIWTAAEFLPAVIWAVIIAIAIWPAREKLTEKLSPGLSAALLTAAVALTIFLPLALTAYQLAQQGSGLVAWIGEAGKNGIKVPEWVARLPVAADAVRDWWNSNLTDPAAAAAWLKSLNLEKTSDFFTTFGGQLLHRAFMLFVSMIALFVLLRSGRDAARQAHVTADRIFGGPGEGLTDKMVVAIRGTVNGTVIVAVVEGLLIGASYVLAGASNALFFTIITIAFAMLPFGAWAAFTAAAATIVIEGGAPWAAFAVFAWGAFVMLTGDHYVWPSLVGGAARLPFLFAFVGIFGGLATFGLLGLFLGPVIMAAMLVIWREWIVAPGR